jgi:Transposase zinc-binding domain
MSRPPFEVADIIRSAGDAFREQYGNSLTWPQHKVLDAIVRCRTAALGGHRDQCLSCGREAISYNSCRNRHCPKCQSGARDQWLARRQQELPNAGYYHFALAGTDGTITLQTRGTLCSRMRRRRYRLKGATKSINLWRDHRLFSCIAAAGTSNDQLDGQDNLLTCTCPLFVSEPSE